MMAIRPLRTEIEVKLKHKVLKRVGYTQSPITVLEKIQRSCWP